MDNRQRRRKRKNAIEETLNMVKTIVLVVIAVVLVILVFAFLRGKLSSLGDSGDSKAGSILENFIRGSETEAVSEAESETSGDVEIATDLQEGLNTDKDGRIFYIKNGELLKDCWLDVEKSLYRFGGDGFAVTGEYSEDAYVYTFSQSGKLTKITRKDGYTDPYEGGEYPAKVEKDGLRVYLVKDSESGENMYGRFRAIKYKDTSVSHFLGGEENKQYTLPGTVQIDGEGYVYWLPLVDSPDEAESRLNGTLYRMKPEDGERQIVAGDVEGYRVATTEAGAVCIYYYKNGSLGRCGSAACRVDESVMDFTEDMEYTTVIKEDRLYLKTVTGYLVNKAFDSFTTGGFTYKIGEDGEILSVAENKEAVLGDYTYTILQDQAFGKVRNAVTRTDKDGKTEMISGEFEGEIRNLFGNEKDGKIYGEFTYLDNAPHIIVISETGDVDMLMDTEADAANIEICAFGEDSVIVKNTFNDGTVEFQEISVSEKTPIALGIDPVDITDMKPESESDTANALEALGPGYAGSSVGTAPDGTAYTNGPASLPTPTAEIPDQPVTVGR